MWLKKTKISILDRDTKCTTFPFGYRLAVTPDIEGLNRPTLVDLSFNQTILTSEPGSSAENVVPSLAPPKWHALPIGRDTPIHSFNFLSVYVSRAAHLRGCVYVFRDLIFLLRGDSAPKISFWCNRERN